MITFIDKQTIESHFDFPELIERLRSAFAQSNVEVPMRHHHDYANPPEDRESTLLLMPAWDPGKDLGVKMVTVSPNNGDYNLPSIQGIYLLFDAHKGSCKTLLDAKSLTAYRTAATSALASSYLSRENSRCLMMIGTGALSSVLIKAHAAVRPIDKVIIWGRDPLKAEALKKTLVDEPFEIEVVETIESGIKNADIISCATLSETPLINGELLKPGQHLDMVGAYRPDMREADDQCLLRSSIFVDHYAGALKETGDIVIPMQQGIIQRADIKAELFELCKEAATGREHSEEITFFKSVGHALEDLVAATLIAEKVNL
ncbi:ornithine cyclodeaminase family protein [Aliikangiella coralliicola]|uniref:Ornithine cyclodeaminase family protein n=1 Tax=Aliikangiella coralliicola TaxID=2592383 RepID=A0A545UHX2_9GAMM|nr:ornithine cyclodeaminase family protein [Aliikangiella coralliicola]TQV89013.1 ornithine cyclodeaminase family protein [Aliikangiella coralliicola]